jgi:hypothetical protein
MRWLIALVLTLSVVGCAGRAAWTKDGVAPNVAALDLSDCRSDAQAALIRDANIQTDIMMSRGRDWLNTGAMSTKSAAFAAEDKTSQDDLVSRCMIGKGYAPGG